MDLTTLHAGDAVELLVDAHAIPAGCYRFREVDGEMILFTIGNEVIFGLAKEFWRHFMRPIKRSNAQLSTASDFAKRYKELYQELGATKGSLDPSRFTFCMLSPRMHRKATSSVRNEQRPIYAAELAV